MEREHQTQTIDACPPDQGTVDRSSAGPTTTRTRCSARTASQGTVVRTLRPHADEVRTWSRRPRGQPAGPGARRRAVVRGRPRGARRLPARTCATASDVDIVDDPYRWLPTLGEIDLHLIGEGRHERLWDALGAHVRTYDTPSGPVTGTSFAVWAPTAQGVRVTGDFDGWGAGPIPCVRWAAPGSGDLRARGRGRHPLQVPDPRLGTACGGRSRTPWPSPRRSRRRRRRSWAALHHEWGDGEWLAAARAAAPRTPSR